MITLQQTQTPYLAASQAAYVVVCDDPDLLYLVQEDSSTTGMVSGASGRNTNLVAGTGNTYSSNSGWMLSSSSMGTTINEQLRIVQLLQQSDNAVGAYAKWLVRLNFGIHPWNNATGV